jgi:hypothetical protein
MRSNGRPDVFARPESSERKRANFFSRSIDYPSRATKPVRVDRQTGLCGQRIRRPNKGATGTLGRRVRSMEPGYFLSSITSNSRPSRSNAWSWSDLSWIMT